nr:hypothetical protein CFP56_06785 [Quercus suber]
MTLDMMKFLDKKSYAGPLVEHRINKIGDKIEKGGGDELQGGDNENEMTRLRFVFGDDNKLQATTRTR